MSNQFELIAELRENVGKGASRRLRRESNLVPAIVYGGGKDPVSISLPHHIVARRLQDEAFVSSILDIKIGKKKEQAVLKNLQRHPSKPTILHMDFLRVTGNDPITMNVPLHFLGEDVAPGVKGGGITSHVMTDIEIKCLPKDLPEFIEVDVSQLDLESSLHISDIVLPQGVSLSSGDLDEEHDLPIFSIHVPKRAAVEEAEEVAPEEEAAEESKPEEGNNKS